MILLVLLVVVPIEFQNAIQPSYKKQCGAHVLKFTTAYFKDIQIKFKSDLFLMKTLSISVSAHFIQIVFVFTD